ncbi:hypothetical protein ACTWQF_12925, partial [Streptomyces sp. 8N114]|uniref:hypothetical protein n=1 Tax=Streptomyces sp. 8N114 TaxID=3457419 RepID=UPI003FD5CA15
VLSTPPAFVLSQDQTLRECFKFAEERNQERNNPPVHSVLAVIFSKEPQPADNKTVDRPGYQHIWR